MVRPMIGTYRMGLKSLLGQRAILRYLIDLGSRSRVPLEAFFGSGFAPVERDAGEKIR
jgi:hypothetical protein